MNLLEKYSVSVPRYTSYPTAPHFTSSVDGKVYANWLKGLDNSEPISLYLHIPFCHQLCWYCGCNTKVINRYDALAAYVESVKAEIERVSSLLTFKPSVSHIHWGGGTPTMLKEEDFKSLTSLIHEHFNVLEDAEIAVEIDPRTFPQSMARALAECGVNRVSFGVQDFDAKVQGAINRIQPYEKVAEVVGYLRGVGISSVNFDLIYGLPLQSEETIAETIRKTLELKPSRIALFGYAHVPWMKKHQQLLEKHALPNAEDRLTFFNLAKEKLEEGGYASIGLDHFALPEDTLVQAQESGKLYRNFQGYTVDEAGTLLAFGASSIGKLPQGFVQNFTSVKEYADAMQQGALATQKGIATDEDDNLRSQLIERLMCDYKVQIPEGLEYDADLIADMEQDGLLKTDGQLIEITELGKPYVRVAASAFDAYLAAGKAKHSMAV